MTGDLSLLKHVHPHIVGILWATSSDLTTHPWPFKDVDYLSNGQLSKLVIYLSQMPTEERKKALSRPELLEMKQFGHPFFISHFSSQDGQKSGAEIIETFSQILKVKDPQIKEYLKRAKEKKPCILVVNETEHKIAHKMSVLFNDLKFQSFRFTST